MPRQFFSLTLLLCSILCLPLIGCKSEDKKQAPVPTPTKAPPAAIHDAAPTPTPEELSSDYFRVEVWHTVPKPTDPVVVSFPSVKIVSASFKPDNLEGGSAQLELDMAALVSGNAKRDKHLKDPDFFEVESYPLAIISIDEVKKKEDGSYGAQARVALHGETQTWPVAFKVVEQEGPQVTIEAVHKFDRSEFKVGDEDTKSIVGLVEASLRVTLTPTE
jgi:polyisoprenoid-binding protein YceI